MKPCTRALSSSALRFAVYVGIIIVCASWGQRSSCLLRQQFFKILLKTAGQVAR